MGDEPGLADAVGRGLVASVAGTAVMTAFQRLVEMPLTGRGDSFAPAALVEKVLPVRAGSSRDRKRLNEATHLALGAMWGTAHGIAAYSGLRGPRAVATVFAAVYTGDVALNTALGLYRPTEWTARDWAVDVVDKLVQAGATGVLFDQVLGPAAGR